MKKTFLVLALFLLMGVGCNNSSSNVKTDVKMPDATKSYKCIKSINCIPMGGNENSVYCSQDYRNWALNNCPDFWAAD